MNPEVSIDIFCERIKGTNFILKRNRRIYTKTNEKKFKYMKFNDCII